MAGPKVSSSCAGCGPWIKGSLVPRPSDTECGESEGLAGYEASPCIGLIHLSSHNSNVMNADSLYIFSLEVWYYSTDEIFTS